MGPSWICQDLNLKRHISRVSVLRRGSRRAFLRVAYPFWAPGRNRTDTFAIPRQCTQPLNTTGAFIPVEAWRLELQTLRTKIWCSTSCATLQYHVPRPGFQPGTYWLEISYSCFWVTRALFKQLCTRERSQTAVLSLGETCPFTRRPRHYHILTTNIVPNLGCGY